jgi:dipeptidyl aminopeptidase/acylaminoacyl peptidase
MGFLPQDPWQIYALNIETGLLRKLAAGKRDNSSPALSPDGKLVAFVSNRAKDPDLDSLRDDLFVIPFAGGRERLIPTPAGPIAGPIFSPSGKSIAYLGHSNPDDAWGVTNFHVWVVGANGGPKARDLMPKFDRMAADQSITDLEDVHDQVMLQWSADGKRLFFLSSDTGATNLYSLPLSGGKPTRIFKGKCHIKGFAVNGSTRIAAFTYADPNTPCDLMTCPTQYGGEAKAKKQTDLNPQLRTKIKLGRTKEVMFTSFDGTEVQGFLVTPPDFKPGRKYPAILEIHGGPRVQYAYTFFHEMQLLAASGYVVFYTNPRGGSGRGETWADAIAGGWGDLDYKDCMAAADYLENLKFVDAKRIGVTGGSYGGWMTNWIIGHTNRFKAAVTQRSVVDLISFTGSSDIGYALTREFDGFPWTNKANYEKCSPIYFMEKVKTPILILHNERDLRCNIEQAEQMFVKLKVLGKTVEFVRFPDEPHGLSRHGRPDRRKARLEWILKWFDRYLK